jgi:hypothetical protein
MVLEKLLDRVEKIFGNKDPNLIIEDMLHRVNKLLHLIGCDFYSDSYTPFTLRMGILTFDIVTYFMINTYSLWHFWGDFEAVAFCSVTMTMGFQVSSKKIGKINHILNILCLYIKGTAKIATFVGNRTFFKKVMLDNIRHYKRSPNPRIVKCQKKMAILCATYAMVIFILYSGAAVLTLTYPLLMTMFAGRTLPFGFILPGLQPLENLGFGLNWIHHILQVWFTIIGLIASDIISGVYLLLIVGQLSMIRTMIDDYTKRERPTSADALDEGLEEPADEMIMIIERHIETTK